ncbi:MAG TPA: GNAT family N-acetyltransferase [Ilumatobacteraceae bacterium]|nr:GNAT family N-acetyltransferase [Ilumatobacteraceae bacterium]
MIDPIVRVTSHEDEQQLRFLELEARAALVDQRGGDRWLEEHPPIGEGWSARCVDGDVYVGTIDEVVIGYLVADLGDDAIVRIDQVWVTPEARELGFGDELLATAIASARARGAIAVEGQALPGDRHTKNLYERAGIVARLITTFRRL